MKSFYGWVSAARKCEEISSPINNIIPLPSESWSNL